MYLEVLPLSRRDILPAQRLEFDRIGVAIWNCCCRLRQNSEECHNPTDMAKGTLECHFAPSFLRLMQCGLLPISSSKLLRRRNIKVKTTSRVLGTLGAL